MPRGASCQSAALGSDQGELPRSLSDPRCIQPGYASLLEVLVDIPANGVGPRPIASPEVAAMCQHQPACPPADVLGRATARIVATHPEQGWNLLCNGVILFDDDGMLLPDGRAVAPSRPTHALLAAA
jgi:Family of unknown function (DUF5999)